MGEGFLPGFIVLYALHPRLDYRNKSSAAKQNSPQKSYNSLGLNPFYTSYRPSPPPTPSRLVSHRRIGLPKEAPTSQDSLRPFNILYFTLSRSLSVAYTRFFALQSHLLYTPSHHGLHCHSGLFFQAAWWQ